MFHETLPNFRVTCKIDGCRDSLTTVRGLVRHVLKKHKNAERDVSNLALDDNVSIQLDGHETLTTGSIDTMDTNEDDVFTTKCLERKVNDFEKHVTQCILSLREKHILPASVQQDIISELQLMVTHVHDTYKALFSTFCSEQNIVDRSCT